MKTARFTPSVGVSTTVAMRPRRKGDLSRDVTTRLFEMTHP
jgi:hypothetical protein